MFFKVLLAKVVIVVIACTSVIAQNLYIKDVQGVPIVVNKVNDVKGSPFLNDDWVAATVKLNNGITYKENMYVKYNQEKGELYFKGKNGETLAFVEPVTEFTIESNGLKHYKNGYKNIPGATQSDFFEILSDGTACLLKRTKSFILESKDYGSPVTIKTYQSDKKYYLIIGEDVKQIRNDTKSVLSALRDKENQVETFIKTNKVKFKSDDDLSKVVNYYNSI
jgi:hypothetical protein